MDEEIDIDTLLKNGYYDSSLKDNADSIILVGPTGSGKSTILKFVCQDPSLRIALDSITEDHIFVDDELLIGSSSHISKTMYPNVAVDKESKTVIVDLSGFNDTRSPKYDLCVSFRNKLVLDAARRLKIVIVEYHSSLEQRGGFLNNLKFVSKLLQVNYQAFEGSIGLIVTKVDSRKTDAQLISSIRRYLDQTRDFLIQKIATGDQSTDLNIQKRLLGFILGGDYCGILRRPTQPGNPWQECELTKNFKDIRQLMFHNLKYSNELSVKCQVSVAPETVNYINSELLMDVKAHLENFIIEIFNSLNKKIDQKLQAKLLPVDKKIAEVGSYCDFVASNLAKLKSLDELELFASTMGFPQSQLPYCISKTRFFCSIVGNGLLDEICVFLLNHTRNLREHVNSVRRFLAFMEMISREFYNFQVLVLNKQIQHYFEQINTHNFTLRTTDWKGFGFSAEVAAEARNVAGDDARSIQNLKDLIQEKTNWSMEITQNEDGCTKITGTYVFLSAIVEHVQSNPPRELVVIALNKIFIDCNLTLQHTHLVFFAPALEVVVSPRIIQLKGEDGKQHIKSTASCSKSTDHNGENGLDGNNGFSSGSVQIFTLKIQNSKLLTIQTTGGNGGDGQCGGIGHNATMPSYPDDVPKKIPDGRAAEMRGYYETFSHLGYSHKTLDSHDTSFVLRVFLLDYDRRYDIEVSNCKGSAPTNGGSGGNAGTGAIAGELILNVQNNFYPSFSQINGTNGRPGQGGKAGINKPKCSLCKYLVGEQHFGSSDGEAFGVFYTLTHKSSYPSNDFFPTPSDGQNGQVIGNALLKYKNNKMWNLQQLVKEFCKGQARREDQLDPKDVSLVFLKYVLSLDCYTESVSFESFLELLKGVEIVVFKGTNAHAHNLRYVYMEILSSILSIPRDKIDYVDVTLLEMEITRRLDLLLSSSSGKQIVLLSRAVEEAIQTISELRKNSKDIKRFAGTQEELIALHKEIADSNLLIESKIKETVSNVEKHIQTTFTDLMRKIKEYREKQVQELENLQRSLENTILLKAFFSLFQGLSKIGSLIWSPAAYLGTMSDAAFQKLLAADCQFIESMASECAKNAENILRDFEAELVLKKGEVRSVLERILEVDGVDKILLNDQERNTVQSWLQNVRDETAGECKFLYNQLENFETLLTIIDSKITTYQTVESREDLVTSLKELRNFVDKAQYTAGVSGGVADAGNCEADVLSAIKANKQAILAMAECEQKLMNQFKPMLQKMVTTFRDCDLAGQSSVALLFQKLELKKYARLCIPMLEQMTRGFDVQQHGLRGAIVDLEELMTTAASAYDKICELGYKVRLTKLLNGFHGSVRDDLYLRVCTETRRSEMVREFLYVFSAFQQVLFPFGADKLHMLNSTLKALKESATLEQVEDVLRGAFSLIKQELSDATNKIVNQRDENLMVSHFDPNFTSSRAFFEWSGADHFDQIERLFLGERVTFPASVFSTGVQNAVKFNNVALRFWSTDPATADRLQQLLKHFDVEMIHSGQSSYRCGARYFAIGGEPLTIKFSYERDATGQFVCRNKVFDKLSYGDVPLSPYTVWKFQLTKSPNSSANLSELQGKLALLADKTVVQLIGRGFYVQEGADICNTDLTRFYTTI